MGMQTVICQICVKQSTRQSTRYGLELWQHAGFIMILTVSLDLLCCSLRHLFIYIFILFILFVNFLMVLPHWCFISLTFMHAYLTFTWIICCLAFQLGSIDHIGPAVKRLGNRYHPHLPLAVEAIETTASLAGKEIEIIEHCWTDQIVSHTDTWHLLFVTFYGKISPHVLTLNKLWYLVNVVISHYSAVFKVACYIYAEWMTVCSVFACLLFK